MCVCTCECQYVHVECKLYVCVCVCDIIIINPVKLFLLKHNFQTYYNLAPQILNRKCSQMYVYDC